jgi:hypothetical protein
MRTSCGQGPQISGLVISHAVLPARKHDANPFEGQGSHYGMVVLTTLALLLVIGTRPNRLRNRVSCPFVKTLPQKLGTRPARVHPFLLSTALRHGRNPAVGSTGLPRHADSKACRYYCCVYYYSFKPVCSYPSPNLSRSVQRFCAYPAVWLSGQSLSHFPSGVGPATAGLRWLDRAGSQNTRPSLREFFSCATPPFVLGPASRLFASACLRQPMTDVSHERTEIISCASTRDRRRS